MACRCSRAAFNSRDHRVPPGQDAGSSSLIDLFGYVADTNPYRLMMLHGPGAGAEPARNLLENAAISEI
jgi:hypothetical protein